MDIWIVLKQTMIVPNVNIYNLATKKHSMTILYQKRGIENGKRGNIN